MNFVAVLIIAIFCGNHAAANELRGYSQTYNEHLNLAEKSGVVRDVWGIANSGVLKNTGYGTLKCLVQDMLKPQFYRADLSVSCNLTGIPCNVTASGTAYIAIDMEASALNAFVTFEGLNPFANGNLGSSSSFPGAETPIVALHLHAGNAETIGPIMASFCSAANPSLPACSQRNNQIYKGYFQANSSFFTVPNSKFKDYLRHQKITKGSVNNLLYVDLHTTYSWAVTRGNGLVRGQLVPVAAPAFLLESCQASQSTESSPEQLQVLPDKMLGSWESKNTLVTSIQGPFFNIRFWAAKDESGAFHFALQIPLAKKIVESQVFFAHGDLMQYCFAVFKDAHHSVKATAPFKLHSTGTAAVVFCWRGPRLPNHAANCTGCSCAKLTLELAEQGHLRLTFLESPPAVHFHAELTRVSSDAPTPAYFHSLLGGVSCEFEDRTGFLTSTWENAKLPRSKTRSILCPVSGGQAHTKYLSTLSFQSQQASEEQSGPAEHCINLNGGVSKTYWKADLRFQYSVPEVPCMPCNVSFSLSATIPHDQYIAIGFKERFEFYTEKIPDQPSYFGMSTSDFTPGELQFPLAGRIVLGYASPNGNCIRDMKIDEYVGSPYDHVGYPTFLHQSAERRNGRTIIRFTAPISLPWLSKADMSPKAKGKMGAMRIMWSIGKVSSHTSCVADIEYHGAFRGLTSLIWFNNPVCKFDASELRHEQEASWGGKNMFP